VSDIDLFRTLLQSIDDSGAMQLATMTGYAGEQLSQVQRVQPFGFHSNPPVGSHGIGLALRSQRRLAVLLGSEAPQYRPTGRPTGTTALYDAYGSLISLIETECRIVHAQTFHVVAPTIILEGNVLLGGPTANKPAAMQGTIDTGGNADVSGLATKVLME
jgi:phage gp45-like